MKIDNAKYLNIEWHLPHHSKMQLIASDIEATGLLEDLVEQGDKARLHNFGMIDIATGRAHTIEGSNREVLQRFLNRPNVVHLMHNGVTFDKEALTILGFDVSKMRVIDTLAISWYLELKRPKHGLASYGEEFGISKPSIDDWENLTQDDYNHRVQEDCRIQQELWLRQYKQLKIMYKTDEKVFEFIQYLMFKVHLQLTQARNPWKLDVEKCERHLEENEALIKPKVEELSAAMPRVYEMRDVKRPKVCHLKGGLFDEGSAPMLSKAGLAYYAIAEAQGNSGDEDITYTINKLDNDGKKISEKGNPNSHVQMKAWLFDLGWVPESFKYERNKKTGETRKIPQVRIKDEEDNSVLCPSIHKLIEKNPDSGLILLSGLTILVHRRNFYKGLIRDQRGGYIVAECLGYTNTLRLKHTKLANIPGVRTSQGEDIRSCLVAEEGYLNLGTDLSALEDKCKFHFMMDFDPEYVVAQNVKGYDPHLAIAVCGGLLNDGQVEDHKLYKKTKGLEGTDYSEVRAKAKQTNYSAQYGVGAPSLAIALDVDQIEAKDFLNFYWDLNWSIRAIAKSTKVVKDSNGTSWQLNPVNGLYYHLKAEKDRFSTLCQGLGAYIFDIWCMHVFNLYQEKYKYDPKYLAQFHDEFILSILDNELAKEENTAIIQEAIRLTGELLKTKVELGCDTQFGKNYSEIH